MKRPQFEPVEKTPTASLLLIDKHGVLTDGILPYVPKNMQVVVVSSKKPTAGIHPLVTFIHFGALMPSIPDRYYSHIAVTIHGEEDVIRLIPQFLEKARTDSSKIFFILDLFFADPAFVQKLTYDYRNAHAIITGDFFGSPRVPSRLGRSEADEAGGEMDEETTIQRFFDEANTTGTIQVVGDGLTTTFPVLFRDAMEEIVGTIFLPKPHKISYVFPKHAPSQIALARIFQSINPFLRIDFVDEKEQKTESFVNAQKMAHVQSTGVHVLQSNYPLLKKIKESNLLSEENIADSIRLAQDSSLIPRDKKPQHGITKPTKVRKGLIGQKKKSSSPLSWIVFFLLLVLLLPAVVTFLFAGTGVAGLVWTKRALFSGDLATARKAAGFSQTVFSIAQTTDTVVTFQSHILGLGTQGEKLEHYLSFGTDGSYALSNAIASAQIMLLITEKKSLDPKNDFINATNKLKKAVTVFQKIRAQKDVSIPLLSELDPLISLLGATIDSYPTLLGMDEKKTYLLLFQNNAEIRPAGGFIGSYGLVTLDKGTVSDFQIHDVYDADGQLTGHVEPAYPFRRYMGIVHQYMRDSNYDVDFPTAASTSANMLFLETGVPVAGVIGIDTSFAKSLVGALSPIYVPDYKETVTAENFYIVTQSHAEKNFFPGSTQKKDFLRSLFKALQLKLADQKHLPYLALSKAVAQAIEEKHMLFAFPDPSLQQLFSANNLSSSLRDSRETKKGTYNDFLGLSEANIGVNKANAFVYRKVEQVATLDEVGRVKNTVTIRYKNDSRDWPGGDYKNYLRVMVPKGARLTDITIDGQKQILFPATTNYLVYERPDFTPPAGLEVETTEQLNKTLFGFLVIVPKGAYKSIVVSYTSPTTLDISASAVTYTLWYFKQPGTDAYTYDFTFLYPKSMKAFNSSEKLVSKDDSEVFNSVITTDQKFFIDVSRK